MKGNQIRKRCNEINKEDTSMASFTKKSYFRPLLPNTESVYKTTNPYFKNTHVLPVSKNEAKFVLVKNIFLI